MKFGKLFWPAEVSSPKEINETYFFFTWQQHKAHAGYTLKVA